MVVLGFLALAVTTVGISYGIRPTRAADNKYQTSNHSAGARIFYSRLDYPIGAATAAPNQMEMVDFNGDGALDAATANTVTDNVSVVFGDNLGAFGSLATYPISGPSFIGPTGIAVGDFDGSGKLDIVTADGVTDFVSVLLNSGTGTFGAAAQFSTGGGSVPFDVVAAPFDADADLDLVVATPGLGNLSFMAGDGAGNFAAPTTFGGPTGYTRLATADFNNDTESDVAAVDGAGFAALFLGDGLGGFTAAGTAATGTTPTGLTVADLNGDNKTDVIVTNADDDTISIFLGDGLGGIGAGTTFAVGDNPQHVTSGDVNGDGKLDLAVSNFQSFTITILLGDGTGSVATVSTVDAGEAPQDLRLVDVNQDGKRDLLNITSNFAAISYFMGNGDGTFEFAPDYATNSDSPQGLVVADFNNDARLDVATANGGSFDEVSVWLGNGDGTLGGANNFTSANAEELRVADFDKDTNLDLVSNDIGPGGGANVLFGDGTGAFSTPTFLAANLFPRDVEVVDANLDTNPDVVVANTNSDNISVFLGDGAGNFGAKTDFAVNDPFKMATSDYDGDGNPDLAITSLGTDVLSVLLGDGVGGFGAATTFPLGDAPGYMKSFDFDNDTDLDLVITNITSLTLSVMRNNGDGTFTSVNTISNGFSAPPVATPGDYDSDGKADLAIAAGGARAMNVYEGDGAGNFTVLGFTYPAGSAYAGMSGDFNADGGIDIAMPSGSARNITMFINRSLSSTASIVATSGSTTVAEGGGTDTIAIALTTQLTGNVTLTIDPGTQLGVSPNTLTFSPSNWNIPQTVTVSAIDDTLVEGLHSGTLQFSAVSADPDFNDVPSYTVTIIDNDSSIIRIPGSTAIEQAINVSLIRIPSAGTGPGIVITRADNLSDAFVAGPLVNISGGTLLLTESNKLNAGVLAEIQRVLGTNTGARIYLVGGEKALSKQIEKDLDAAGFKNFKRLQGINRRATAAEVAREIALLNPSPTKVAYLSEDQLFIDAFGISSVASNVADGQADYILLTGRGNKTLDTFTSAFLKEHSELTSIEIVGGDKAVPLTMEATLASKFKNLVNRTRVAGAVRFDTNRAIADKYYPAPTRIVLTNGETAQIPGARTLTTQSVSGHLFSALLAGSLAGANQSPLLITRATVLPTQIDQYIRLHANTIEQAIIVGSFAQVSQVVEDLVKSLI
jgi:putative cell wall-binding protein